MNWEFHAVTTRNSAELISDHRQNAAFAIEAWLDHVVEEKEVQPESGFLEKPRGFYAAGPWYSYRMTVWGPGGCLNPPEYDVKVEQTFYPKFDKKVFEREMGKRIRVRKIGDIHAIE